MNSVIRISWITGRCRSAEDTSIEAMSTQPVPKRGAHRRRVHAGIESLHPQQPERADEREQPAADQEQRSGQRGPEWQRHVAHGSITSPRNRNFASAMVPTKPNSAISSAMSKYTVDAGADAQHQQREHAVDVEGIEREHPILRGGAAKEPDERDQHRAHETERGEVRGQCKESVHSKILISGRS